MEDEAADRGFFHHGFVRTAQEAAEGDARDADAACDEAAEGEHAFFVGADGESVSILK